MTIKKKERNLWYRFKWHLFVVTETITKQTKCFVQWFLLYSRALYKLLQGHYISVYQHTSIHLQNKTNQTKSLKMDMTTSLPTSFPVLFFMQAHLTTCTLHTLYMKPENALWWNISLSSSSDFAQHAALQNCIWNRSLSSSSDLAQHAALQNCI